MQKICPLLEKLKQIQLVELQYKHTLMHMHFLENTLHNFFRLYKYMKIYLDKKNMICHQNIWQTTSLSLIFAALCNCTWTNCFLELLVLLFYLCELSLISIEARMQIVSKPTSNHIFGISKPTYNYIVDVIFQLENAFKTNTIMQLYQNPSLV